MGNYSVLLAMCYLFFPTAINIRQNLAATTRLSAAHQGGHPYLAQSTWAVLSPALKSILEADWWG